MAKNQCYEIINQGGSTAKIRIYGAIPDWDMASYKEKNVADEFVRDYEALLATHEFIQIHINSPGGSLHEAMPMFNALMRYKERNIMVNDGIAYSAGSHLMMAGAVRKAPRNAMFMIHNSGGFCFGNAANIMKYAALLQKHDALLANEYAAATGWTVEKVMADLLNYEDNFYTAEEALEMGLITEIEDSEAALPENPTDISAVWAHFEKQSMPTWQRVVSAILPEKKATTKTHPPKKNTSMNFKDLAEKLINATPEAVEAVRNDLQQYADAPERYTAQEVQARLEQATEPLKTQLSEKDEQIARIQASANALQAEVDELSKKLEKPTPAAASDPNLKADPYARFRGDADAEAIEIRKKLGLPV